MHEIAVCSDDQLMSLARSGVQGAFDLLVRRHQTHALSVATRFVGDRSLAADVVQDTFWQVHRALDQYRADGKFGPYLRRVLVNQCRMTYRRLIAERRCTQALMLILCDTPSAADSEYAAREQQQRLEAAFDKLGDKLKVVLELRVTHGLSYREIAETLSIPVGTVKRRIFEATTKLRSVLHEACATTPTGWHDERSNPAFADGPLEPPAHGWLARAS